MPKDQKMINTTTETQPGTSFIILMALLMSLVALSIDAMIPAMSVIGEDLQAAKANDAQLIIAVYFLGMSAGIVFFGPFSDSFGRKAAIYLGLALFLLGCLVSLFAGAFATMLVGRLLQGFGGATCRIVVLAIVRDRCSGKQMAKVMSFIMIVFIFIPAIAPAIGQVIMTLSHWRAIFVAILALAIGCSMWFYWGQEETLAPANRLPFSWASIKFGVRTTLTDKQAVIYTLVGGLVFSCLVSYLSTAQQILQQLYQLGDKFPLAFGYLALFIGLASYANAQLVDRYGIEQICLWALRVIAACTSLFLVYCLVLEAQPDFYLLMLYLSPIFFCFGLLFGNVATMAVQHLGHIAGIANSVTGCLQSLLAVAIGGLIGYAYDGSVLPLVLGFLAASSISLFIITKAQQAKDT